MIKLKTSQEDSKTDVYNIFSRESDSRIANVRPSVRLTVAQGGHKEFSMS